MNHALTLSLMGLLWLLPLSSLAGTPLHSDVRESTSKPFWIDKSSFTHEGFLYGVGVIGGAKSLDEGRGLAFEAGKRELQQALQITHIQNTGLTINTVETYEESNEDGTYTVYRLLAIPLANLPPLISEQKRQPHKKETNIEYHERRAKESWRLAFSERNRHQRELYESEAKGHERAIEIINEDAKRRRESDEKERAYKECLKEARQLRWCPLKTTTEELKAFIASEKQAKTTEKRWTAAQKKRPIHERLKKENECQQSYKTVKFEDLPPVDYCTSWREDSEEELKEHEANYRVAEGVLYLQNTTCKELFGEKFCGKLMRDGRRIFKQDGPDKFFEYAKTVDTNLALEDSRERVQGERLTSR